VNNGNQKMKPEEISMIINVDEAPLLRWHCWKRKFTTGKRPFRHPGLQPDLF
jgi:hypothetical protein